MSETKQLIEGLPFTFKIGGVFTRGWITMLHPRMIKGIDAKGEEISAPHELLNIDTTAEYLSYMEGAGWKLMLNTEYRKDIPRKTAWIKPNKVTVTYSGTGLESFTPQENKEILELVTETQRHLTALAALKTYWG